MTSYPFVIHMSKSMQRQAVSMGYLTKKYRYVTSLSARRIDAGLEVSFALTVARQQRTFVTLWQTDQEFIDWLTLHRSLHQLRIHWGDTDMIVREWLDTRKGDA